MPVLFPFFLGLSVCLANVMASSAPVYKSKVYADEVLPYTYKYAVADDYSKVSFSADESSDGASNVQGSYSVALPDGRIQRVVYTSNEYDGYVADVTYEGTAQYPETVRAYKPVSVAVAVVPSPEIYKATPVVNKEKPVPILRSMTYNPKHLCPGNLIFKSRSGRCGRRFFG